jgi:hypothetical protein
MPEKNLVTPESESLEFYHLLRGYGRLAASAVGNLA